MDYDTNKVDEAALALLYLTLHDDFRAWKELDWGITNRLYEKGLIFDPKNKNKSIQFTPDGLKKAEEIFTRLFKKDLKNPKGD